MLLSHKLLHIQKKYIWCARKVFWIILMLHNSLYDQFVLKIRGHKYINSSSLFAPLFFETSNAFHIDTSYISTSTVNSGSSVRFLCSWISFFPFSHLFYFLLAYLFCLPGPRPKNKKKIIGCCLVWCFFLQFYGRENLKLWYHRSSFIDIYDCV